MTELKINACACQQPHDNGGVYCLKCRKMLRKWIYSEPVLAKTRPEKKTPRPKLCVCELPTNNGYDVRAMR